jgi:hypothetical protein
MNSANKRYISQFVRLKCAGDLLNLGLFPNAKEITESMAARHAVFTHILKPLGLRKDDPNIAVAVIGDGHTPRTGALFAFTTAWRVYSIDLEMRVKYLTSSLQAETTWDAVKRLDTWRGDVLKTVLGDTAAHDYILVFPHSHAPLKETIERWKVHDPGCVLHVVSIPCCVKHELPQLGFVYQDYGIWSPCNEVKVWPRLTVYTPTPPVRAPVKSIRPPVEDVKPRRKIGRPVGSKNKKNINQ